MSSTSENEWGPGYLVADRYRIVSQLGRGGMGSVWRAEHVKLESPVAIKVIDPAIAGSEEALSRFMREAKAAAALRSPNVVQIFDYGVHEGVPYIAMELLQGESLAGRLERAGRLSPEETAHVIAHVARAIGKAHGAGIVHRDLKPDNIFLVRNEDEEIVKVLDFGIAKATEGTLGSTSQTRTGALLGTPYYMSPEQAEGNKDIDTRTDLWSMGVIAFECIVGRRPFESDALGDLILQICARPIPIPSRLCDVPRGFDEWFSRSVARNRDERFASAREMAKELRSLLPGAEATRASMEVETTDTDPEAAGETSAGVAASSFGVTTGQASAAVLAEDPPVIPKQSFGRILVGAGAIAVLLVGTTLFVFSGGRAAGSSDNGDPTTASALQGLAEADGGGTDETEPSRHENDTGDHASEQSSSATPTAEPSAAKPPSGSGKEESGTAKSPDRARAAANHSRPPAPTARPQPVRRKTRKPSATRASPARSAPAVGNSDRTRSGGTKSKKTGGIDLGF